MPDISCLVVSHNKPEFLHHALRSILGQTFQDWEAIVMDSGLLHDSGYFSSYPWMSDPRMTIMKSGETAEMQASKAMAPWCWNECHRRGLVRGELVVYLCDDDVWYANAFGTFVEWFRENPDALAAYASQDVGVVYPNGRTEITKERRARGVGGQCIQGRRMNCLVDYLQFCHRRAVLNRFPTDEYWPEGLATQAHADGVFMERVGLHVPIYPIDIKVGLNLRTPQSTYDPSTNKGADQGAGFSESVSRSTHAAGPIQQQVQCSIILSVCNEWEKTHECLSRIVQATRDVEYEIIIVDDGSTDATVDFLGKLSNDVWTIRNPHSRGFSISNNQAAAKAKGIYLVFVDSNVLPQAGWLTAMIDVVEGHPNIGVVGAKCLDSAGYIWHAGIGFTRGERIPYHIYQGVYRDWFGVSMRREFKAVSASCMLVRRDLFENVEGFAEGLENFTEVDLCLKIGELGFKVIYCPECIVTHRQVIPDHQGKSFQASQEQFLGKWGAKIMEDEDAIYFGSQCYLEVTNEDNQISRSVHTLQDQRLTNAWGIIAAIQQQASTRNFEPVRRYFVPSEWPKDHSILQWGADICREAGWPNLAKAFEDHAQSVKTSRPYPKLEDHLQEGSQKSGTVFANLPK